MLQDEHRLAIPAPVFAKKKGRPEAAFDLAFGYGGEP
jgi:hypothetical protein